MFRTLTLISMRQQQGHPIHTLPFLLRGCDELVYDRLRAIRKIAELRFPEHQHIGVGKRISIFESQYTVLAEQRIVDPELPPGIGKTAETVVLLVRILVAKDGMAMRERSPLHILTTHPDVFAFQQQAAISEELARCPVYLTFFIE